MRLRWPASAALCATLLLLASCGGTSLNPTPTVSALFPPTLPATLIGAPTCTSNPSFTINVSGNNFLTNSVAYWNGSMRKTSFNDATGQLTVTILACDIASPGVAYVSVTNPPPGGGPSPSAATFQISQPANPAPSISSLSPASTAAGTLPPGGILTINGAPAASGSNSPAFLASSQAAINGNARATTFVSATELQVQMVASDVTTAGTLTVSVTNPAPGGGVSSAPFTVTDPPNGMNLPQVISISATGGAANGRSSSPAMSSSGRYVAFYSEATNLVTSGASGNIFVRDTCVGATTSCTPRTIAVDLAPNGSAPDSGAGDLAISASGRYVAFASSAKNLVRIDASEFVDDISNVFVRDTCLGAPSTCVPHTMLVSQDVDGGPSQSSSAFPSISADGRFVAFLSLDSSLVAGLSESNTRIFVRDTCASVPPSSGCVPKTFGFAADVTNPEVRAGSPIVSEDGRYVAYTAMHPESETSPAFSEIALLDTCLGSVVPANCAPSSRTSVSVLSDGSPILAWNRSQSVSADGRFVAFSSSPLGSQSDDLLQSLRAPSVSYLRDTCLGSTAPAACVPSTTTLEDLDSGGSTPRVHSPWISPDGRFITFSTGIASEGNADFTHWLSSVMVRDTCVGAPTSCSPRTYPLAVENSTGSQTLRGDMFMPVPLSSDGHLAAFSNSVDSLASPTSGLGDVFLTLMPASATQHNP